MAEEWADVWRPQSVLSLSDATEAMAPVAGTRSNKPAAPSPAFDDLILEFARKLSPGKADSLDVSKIDINRVKRAILDQLQQQEEQEPSTSTSLPQQIAKPKFVDQFSARTAALVRNASDSNLSSQRRGSTSNSSVQGDFTDKRQQRDFKKRAEIRQKRRQSRQTDHVVELDCPQESLCTVLKLNYERLLSEFSLAAQIFNILVTSVRNYCRKITWTANVDEVTRETIARELIQTSSNLGEKFKNETVPMMQQIKEYEVQTLLQMFVVVDLKDRPLNDDAISNAALMLRMVHYAEGGQRHAEFMDDTLLDELLDQNELVDRRRHLASLFEEMERTLPQELAAYGSADDAQSSVGFSPFDYDPRTSPRRNSLVLEHAKQASKEELKKTKATKTARIKKPKLNKTIAVVESALLAPKKKKLDISGAPSPLVNCKAVPETPRHNMMTQSEKRRKRRKSMPAGKKLVIPETPEQKVVLPLKIKIPARQSPRDHPSTRAIMAQPGADGKRKGGKVTKKSSETRNKDVPKLGRAFYLQDFGSDIQGKSPTDPNNGSRPPLSVRKNLATEFSDPSAPNVRQRSSGKSAGRSGQSNPDRTPDAKQGALTLRLKRPRVESPDSAGVKHVRLSDEHEAACQTWLLPECAVDSYKEHIMKLRNDKYKKKATEGEVFYGRGTQRQNVFEQKDGGPMRNTDRVTRQSSGGESKRPKNRTGRKVRTTPEVSHVANYLLNVQNDKPTAPFSVKTMASKLNQLSPFKINRMLRLPSRHRRKQLQRQRQKAEEEGGSNGTDRSDERSITSDRSQPPSRELSIELAPKDVMKDLASVSHLLLSPRNGFQPLPKPSLGLRPRSASLSMDGHPVRRSERLGAKEDDLDTCQPDLDVKMVVAWQNTRVSNGYSSPIRQEEKFDSEPDSPVFDTSTTKFILTTEA